MGHLNELQEKYGDRGLSVLGITSEGESETEPWIRDKGVEHAYAYDRSGKLMRELGVTGLPSAFLLDPSGTIVWKGHPASLRDAEIEKALAGALPRPLWEWPKETTSLRKALVKGEYQKALQAAEKLEIDDRQAYVDIVKGAIEGRLRLLTAARDRGDFLKAFALAGELKAALKGLPEADEVASIYDGIKGDAKAQDVIKAQKELKKLEAEAADLRKKKDAEVLLGKLSKLREKNAGTFAAEQASELAGRIRKQMPDLR